MTTNVNEVAPLVRAAARPLLGSSMDYDGLMEAIGNSRVVLIGEASHGTHEFYRERARITRRLIEEKGFTGVAAEADWPDAYRVNRFVRGEGDDASSIEALRDFQRFPKWMWRNEDVQEFLTWLRAQNQRHPDRVAGFYGIDLYSLHRSMDAVIAYLDKADPEAAQRARQRYACFEDFGEDPQQYGMHTTYGFNEPCEDEVVAQLVDLQGRSAHLAQGDEDEYFFAQQNARLAKNAEQYYRSMFRGRNDSWNLRDTHMAETVHALLEHHARQGREAKLVVWAHNSHLGDARATEMGRGGELNVGQLLHQQLPGEVFGVGFSTYTGTVTAADDWGAEARRKQVRPGLNGSYEALFHEVGRGIELGNFWLNLREQGDAVEALREERLQRAIGVIYRPETERWSHYFHAQLPAQFDAMLHFDETSAVVPLDATSGGPEEEVPDTYPSGQ